jgi:hypothetical protein
MKRKNKYINLIFFVILTAVVFTSCSEESADYSAIEPEIIEAADIADASETNATLDDEINTSNISPDETEVYFWIASLEDINANYENQFFETELEFSNLSSVLVEFINDFKDAVAFWEPERINRYVREPMALIINKGGWAQLLNNPANEEFATHNPNFLRPNAQYARPWLSYCYIRENDDINGRIVQISFETYISWYCETWGLTERSAFHSFTLHLYEAEIYIVGYGCE